MEKKNQKEQQKPIEQMEQEEERKLMEQKKPRRKRKKQEPDVSAVPMVNIETVKPATEDLVLKALREMGCHCTVEKEVPFIHLIHFCYRGQIFFIQCQQDCSNITLSHLCWYEMPMDGDIEEFACMQKAVNKVNSHGRAIVYYSFDEEERTIDLSSRYTILFAEDIIHLDNYLEAMLKLFFKIQRDVMIEIEKYRVRAGLVDD